MPGAIVIVGVGSPSANSGSPHNGGSGASLGSFVPLACVEVLGQSCLGRCVDNLRAAGIDTISVVADTGLLGARDAIERSVNAPISWVVDCNVYVSQAIDEFRRMQIDSFFLTLANAHVEIDYVDALQCHQERSSKVTRVMDDQGTLDVWIVDPNQAAGTVNEITEAEDNRYELRGYLNRLQRLPDLRRLAIDSFHSRCQLRPRGQEVRPGVWIHPAADLHRGARVVAPAFVGKGARIEEQCLITRCSNVESDCLIDYGTVIEDSSVLSNSYVGIGLDLCHAVVNGNQLVHLEREVTLEITDPAVIRRNRVPRNEVNRHSSVEVGILGA